MLDIEKAWELLNDKLQNWVELSIKSLPNFALALFIIILFYFLAHFLKSVSFRLLRRLKLVQSVQNLILTFIHTTTILIGFFISLGILNLEKTVTSLLAGAGIIGLALGFAFQEIASNFVSGVFIAFKKPYRNGDIVETRDILGVVTSIDLRTTTLTTFQGLEVMVPNKILFTEPVTNYTNTPQRRIDIEVGVSYGDNLSNVEALLKESLNDLPHRIESRPVDVFYTEFANSSINLHIHVWVDYPNHRHYLITRSEAVKKVKSVFDQNDITIPFPIRTLDFGIKGGKPLTEMELNINNS